MNWTTPEAIAQQVRKRWDRGDILAARITGESIFPLELRLKRPGPREVANRFGEVQDWVRALSAASSPCPSVAWAMRIRAAGAAGSSPAASSADWSSEMTRA